MTLKQEQTNTKIFLIKMETLMCWEWVFPSLMIPPVPQNQHWMTRHAQKPAPTSCDCRTVRGLRGGRREERMLGCCFSATGWFSSSFGWKVAMGGCQTASSGYFVSQSLSPTLAGRIVALVVVPGVLVAVAAVLRLLERNHNKQGWIINFTEHLELFFVKMYPTKPTIESVYC